MRKTFGNRLATGVMTAIIAASAVFSLAGCGNSQDQIQKPGIETEEAAAADTSAETETADKPADETAAPEGAAGAEAQRSEVAGIYKLREIRGGSQATSEEDVALLENLGLIFFIELKDDGTLTGNMFGEEMNGIWNENMVSIAGAAVSYKAEEDMMTLTEGDAQMIMQRTTQKDIDRILSSAQDDASAAAGTAEKAAETENTGAPEDEASTADGQAEDTAAEQAE